MASLPALTFSRSSMMASAGRQKHEPTQDYKLQRQQHSAPRPGPGHRLHGTYRQAWDLKGHHFRCSCVPRMSPALAYLLLVYAFAAHMTGWQRTLMAPDFVLGPVSSTAVRGPSRASTSSGARRACSVCTNLRCPGPQADAFLTPGWEHIDCQIAWHPELY